MTLTLRARSHDFSHDYHFYAKKSEKIKDFLRISGMMGQNGKNRPTGAEMRRKVMTAIVVKVLTF